MAIMHQVAHGGVSRAAAECLIHLPRSSLMVWP
jgi:hypothetical protein